MRPIKAPGKNGRVHAYVAHGQAACGKAVPLRGDGQPLCGWGWFLQTAVTFGHREAIDCKGCLRAYW